ncbi:MAG: hypothetical protein AAF414_06465 [Pseudomonadota bacterium]
MFPKWRHWTAAALFSVALSSNAAGQPVPDYVDHPLSLLDQEWVRPDPSNNGTPITFFGVGDLDLRCSTSPAFMTLAEAVALSIVYYSYAENAFRGDFSTSRPGYPVAYDFGQDPTIGAIDLLKRIDQAQLNGLIQLVVERLSGHQRELAQAALSALLGRYQPTIDRLEELGDLLPALQRQLDDPFENFDAIQQFGLPRDGDPCFENVFYFNVRIGDQTSYAAVLSMDDFLDRFWVRRYTDGSYRLVASLLQQTQALLQQTGK